MTGTTGNQARSLIVVSGSYGELGLAVSFLRGQEFASRAAIVLPERLYAENKDSLPVPVFRYGTREDILGVVDAHRPHLVFLFSAYLFSLERLLSLESVNTLLRQLRERGCRVITSDPMLGLAPVVTRDQIEDTRMVVPGESAFKRRLLRIMLRLLPPTTKVIRVPSLEDVPHLYPAAIPFGGDRTERLSFFNPTIIRGATRSPAVGDVRVHGGQPDTRPRWLFVLSAPDLHVQRTLLGLREFTELLLGMLRHTVEADRHATLIAPPLVIDRLAGALTGAVDLLPGCPFAEFEQRVLNAEYLFGWNPFSFSQLPRLVNELPVFLFDRGHLARTIKPYYELARATHIGGWEPTYLDQRQLFSPYVLAHLAKAQKPIMRALRERWQQSPTPDALVDQLLGQGTNTQSA